MPTPGLDKDVTIPQCVQDGMRGPLSALARFVNWVRPMRTLINVENPGVISIPVDLLTAPDNDPVGTVVVGVAASQGFFVEGVLDEDLKRDLFATMSLIDPTTDAVYSPNQTIEVHGRYVPSGKKALSGARCAAFYNGVKWRGKVIDGCVGNDP